MAKRRKKAVAPRPLTRKQRSRAAREARMNRLIIGGAIAVGVLVVGVLAYGYFTEVVAKSRRPVAVVNGVPIRAADLEKRVQARLLETRRPAEYADTIRPYVLSQMVDEELIRQEAARLGITVSPEEVDREIERWFGFDREATEGPAVPITGPVTQTEVTTATESITEEEFQRRYQEYVEQVLEPSGLGVEGFRAMIEVTLLYRQVRAKIEEAVPTVADQVQIRYLSFPSEEEANAAFERLEQGDDWEAIAQELEGDETEAAYARELDWRTETFISEQFGAEIGQTVFAMDEGAYSQPLLGNSGRYYIVQLLAHEEREMDSLMLEYERERAFGEWLAQQRQSVEYGEGWGAEVITEP